MPAPPQAVLAAFDLDDLLDSAAPASAWSPPAATSAQEVAPPMLMSSADMIAPASGETPPSADTAAASLHLEALEAAVRQDPDVSLHSHIYRMLAECEADVFEGLDNELMVQQQGHDLILDSLALARCELAYHPLRYEAWERVLSKPLCPFHCSLLITTACNSTLVGSMQLSLSTLFMLLLVFSAANVRSSLMQCTCALMQHGCCLTQTTLCAAL